MNATPSPRPVSSEPKVSIITAVYNNAEFVRVALESAKNQDYPNIEHIIIDGGSTDRTLDILHEHKDQIATLVSEPDNGIYDALNKGIERATGKYIAFLHSDDVFGSDSAISRLVEQAERQNAEFCCSDVIIVDRDSDRIIRFYRSHFFKEWLFKIGWMPPHPGCLFQRALHDEFGLYSTRFKIAGDFDFMVRMFFGRKIRWTYLNQVTMKMKRGGASNSGFASKRMIAQELSQSLEDNGVNAWPILQVLRYPIRALELVTRPK